MNTQLDRQTQWITLLLGFGFGLIVGLAAMAAIL